MDSKSIVDYLFALYDKLSWVRLGQVAVAMVLAAGGFIFWQSRDSITQMVKPAKFSTDRLPLIVSSEAKRAIDETLRKAPMFAAIGVVSVNFQQNTRRLIYLRSSDPAIEKLHQDYLAEHPAPDIALINSDEKNNNRVVRLINGELVCLPFEDSRSAPYFAGTGILYVCATAVPDYWGAFRGTIISYLKIVPSAEEQTQVRILLRALSQVMDNPSSQGKPLSEKPVS